MLKNYTCHGVADKRSRKELKVRQKSYGLCLEIYRITAKFPKEERYGLTSQVRRSVVSIPSNIAKGYGRKTTMDYIRMLYITKQTLESLDPLLQLNWRRTLFY